MQSNVRRDRRHRGMRGKIVRHPSSRNLGSMNGIVRLAMLPALIQMLAEGRAGTALGAVLEPVKPAGLPSVQTCWHCNAVFAVGHRHECSVGVAEAVDARPGLEAGPGSLRHATLRAFLRAGGAR